MSFYRGVENNDTVQFKAVYTFTVTANTNDWTVGHVYLLYFMISLDQFGGNITPAVCLGGF